MKTLREELEEILDMGDDVAKEMDITIKGEPTVKVDYIKAILSRHPEEEPLEKLAERKGAVMTVEFTKRGWAPNMRMTADEAHKYLEGLEVGK